MKISKKYDHLYDLNLTPLENIDEKYKITLLENNTIYIFSIFDLFKIIKNSLTFSKFLIHTIKLIKNPYTNTPFSIANLYNVYYHNMFNSHITLPYYVYCYFQNELLNKKFVYYNYIKIKEINVIDYINETSNDELYEDIKDLFYDLHYEYNFTNKNLNILSFKEKDKVNLLEKCKGLLKDYLLIRIYSK
jgi:hypothetical protein